MARVKNMPALRFEAFSKRTSYMHGLKSRHNGIVEANNRYKT
jgi:hypothetical protein